MSVKNVKYLVANSGRLSFYWNSTAWHVEKTNPNYDKILEKVKAGEMNGIEALTSPKARVEQTMGATVVNGQVFFKGREVKNAVVDRILEFNANGWKCDNLKNFLDKLLLNPSERSQENSYRFLEHNKMPILEDGDFLAYKRVGENYKDLYSGKFDNTPGQKLEIPRENVDSNEELECSFGLHVSNLPYARDSYGNGRGRLIVCKVNPKDVVAVTHGFEHQKIRVCAYEVIEEMKEEYRQDQWISLESTEDWEDEEEDDEDDLERGCNHPNCYCGAY